MNIEPVPAQQPTGILPLDCGRLLLRRFSDADLPLFMAYRNDPEVARYQGWEASSVAEATAFIRRQATLQAGLPGEWLQIAIALKATGLLIGDCALKIHSGDVRQATIGVTLAKAYQGRGFAAEALTTLLDYLFTQMNLHRVIADTDPQNTPSWTLLERLGMRREGCFVQSLWFKGRWVDEYSYAVLKEEWLQKCGQSIK